MDRNGLFTAHSGKRGAVEGMENGMQNYSSAEEVSSMVEVRMLIEEEVVMAMGKCRGVPRREYYVR
jgi:hypothetical protein